MHSQLILYYGCFNEAAGIHRRKLQATLYHEIDRGSASMRPPEFTGGNSSVSGQIRLTPLRASMRPPEFTGGNLPAL